ncbi:selenium cofactor biosynthesis protein YqeC [Haloparvum sp. AD34]
MNLVEAFRAEDAAVAVVGAGGKKTTMYALADRLDRAVVTAAVRIPIFDQHVARVAVTESPLDELAAADPGDFPLGLVPERESEERYYGYDATGVDDIVAAHDGPVLIKSDGARMRDFKAPKDTEPQIPSKTDVVVPIASAHAVGEPLDEAMVHRPELVAQLAADAGLDVAVGDEITPELVATVLASDDGGLKRVPEGATVIPLVNKVDDADDESVARAVADAFFDRLDERRDAGAEVPEVPHLVLGHLAAGDVVDVVEA